jgi:NAD(P)H-dependent flavin oxidoreductase YrpB (nitropropane dioxygenase family)
VLRTPFTELLGIDHPVVCVGMGGGATNGELAGQVSEAGGLGVIRRVLRAEDADRSVGRIDRLDRSGR